MTQRLVKETGINLAVLKSLKSEGKPGPFPVNHPWGNECRSGKMEIVKVDNGRLALILADPLGGEPIRWAGNSEFTPQRLIDVLSSNWFRVTCVDRNEMP